MFSLNRTAMAFLQRECVSEAIKLLHQALTNLFQAEELQADETIGSKIAQLKNQLLGLTHNNLGCAYK